MRLDDDTMKNLKRLSAHTGNFFMVEYYKGLRTYKISWLDHDNDSRLTMQGTKSHIRNRIMKLYDLHIKGKKSTTTWSQTL